jgi:hypothetical protein
VSQAPIASNIHQALDIHLNFAAQVPFDTIFFVDNLTQP